jgi:hypothetical protein
MGLSNPNLNTNRNPEAKKSININSTLKITLLSWRRDTSLT